MKRNFFLTAFFMLTVVYLQAATFDSKRAGNWHDPCTWVTGVCVVGSIVPIIGVNIPGPNDDVIISGDNVTVNAATKAVYGGGTINVRNVEVSGNTTLTVTGAGVRLNVYQGSAGERCNLLFSSNNSGITINNGAFVDVQGGMCIRTCSVTPNAINTTGGGFIRVGGCVDCGNGSYTQTGVNLAGCAYQNSVGIGLDFCLTCTGVCSLSLEQPAGSCGRIILLPVTFVSVAAAYQPASDAVMLNWSTSSEKNNSKFEIERSTDGLNYQRIGVISSKIANSIDVQIYQYLDKYLPQSNVIYYRLKQHDLDGQYSYSKMVVINRKDKLQYSSIYPNPSENGSIFITIDGDNSQKMEISYITLQGVTVLAEEIIGVAGTTKFSPKQILLSGTYLVVVKTDENTFFHKLLVNK